MCSSKMWLATRIKILFKDIEWFKRWLFVNRWIIKSFSTRTLKYSNKTFEDIHVDRSSRFSHVVASTFILHWYKGLYICTMLSLHLFNSSPLKTRSQNYTRKTFSLWNHREWIQMTFLCSRREKRAGNFERMFAQKRKMFRNENYFILSTLLWLVTITQFETGGAFSRRWQPFCFGYNLHLVDATN